MKPETVVTEDQLEEASKMKPIVRRLTCEALELTLDHLLDPEFKANEENRVKHQSDLKSLIRKHVESWALEDVINCAVAMYFKDLSQAQLHLLEACESISESQEELNNELSKIREQNRQIGSILDKREADKTINIERTK